MFSSLITRLPFGLSIMLLGLLMGCATTPGRVSERGGAAGSVVHVVTSGSGDGFAENVRRLVPGMLAGLPVSFAPQPITDADLRLDLRMTWRNTVATEFETIWQQATLFLMTVYPSTCRHRDYVLTATLSDAHGHSRTYEKAESTVAWLWLLIGPGCGETPAPQEIATMSERMLKGVFAQMRQDDAFARIGRNDPAANAPLVKITVNRATEITAQVLSVDRTFPRWTLGDDAAQRPDYRVDLRFDVQPGGFSIDRAYLGIMTFGLTSPCRWSTITLVATVTGPAAVMTRSYTFADSFFGRMESFGRMEPTSISYCLVPDETNQPDVFAKLLRRAFRQIAEEKLIEKAPLPAGGTLPPLIRVSAARAEGIVRHETARMKPFARCYFHDTAEYAPDYTLTLAIQFAGGDRKQFTSIPAGAGAGLAIALGVNLVCNPTLMILDAVLSDCSGKEVRRYHIERLAGFSNNRLDPSSCQDDESSNPDAVGKLVRALYAEMQADGTLAGLQAGHALGSESGK